MSKLNSKSDVIERYWAEYISHCMRNKQYIAAMGISIKSPTKPTVDGFWYWYITDGPMGVKSNNQFYNEDRVEYV